MKRSTTLFLLLAATAAFGAVQHDHSKRPATAHATISLPTVKCDLCAETVQKAVQKVAGVQTATVDLKTKTAHVAFDSARTSVAKIEKAVAAAGYDANGTKRDEKAYAKLPKCCQ